MTIKNIWTGTDFDVMGWHDCRLYSFNAPNEDFQISFDIDYIFEWSENSKFLVAPCYLRFKDVANFTAKFEFGDRMLLFINEVKKANPQKSPNGNIVLWDYEIICDNAEISFTASDFEMIVRCPAIVSKSLDLGRANGH